MENREVEVRIAEWTVKRIPLEYIPAGVRVLEDVAYGPENLQKVDAYLPEGRAPRPVLVEFHGGGWRTGDKRQLGMYKGVMEKVLEAGIAVVAANYRLTPKDPWPAQAEDAVRVVQFVRSRAKEWNLDPSRVVLIGGSAGAHLSMWVAMHDDLADPESEDPIKRFSSRVSGVIDCWGPSDLTRFVLEGRGVAIGTQLFECTAEEWDLARVADLRREASPAMYLTPDDPPMMLIYTQPEVKLPDSDWTTADGHSSLFGVVLRKQLAAAGVRAEVIFEATPETWGPAIPRFLQEVFGMEDQE